MDWKDYLEKIRSKKIDKKTVKIKVELPHVNKKPLARKVISVQTTFSHYFKIRAKNFKPQKHLLHFLFDFTFFEKKTWRSLLQFLC